MVGIPYCCGERPHWKKAKRYAYLPSDFEDMHTLVESMESKLFNTVLSNACHVLYQLLRPEKDIGYNLRQRSHPLSRQQFDQEEFLAYDDI